MQAWVSANAGALVTVLAVSAGAMLVISFAVLVSALRARRQARRVDLDSVAAERRRIELELDLAEQTGRLRIIRELQEVSVQQLSAIISQAEGAGFAATADPAAAARSAAVIADSARTTLGDLRRVLDLAREGEAIAEPQPRLLATNELFSVMRDSGLDISVDESGEPFALQQGAELAISRILQEALSNALSFGGPGTEARVSFTRGTEGLHVKVDDNGIRATARRDGLDPNDANSVGYTIDDDLKALTDEPTGRGIREMRVRAEVYGGLLTASTVPGVGFSLSVVFPALRFHNGVHGVKLGRS